MGGFREIVVVSLLGLLTTSSSMVGAALGLYVPLSKRMLACGVGIRSRHAYQCTCDRTRFRGRRRASSPRFQRERRARVYRLGFRTRLHNLLRSGFVP